MNTTQRFIERSQKRFDRLSILHSVRSSFPLYLFSGLLLVYAGGIVSIVSGFKDLAWVVFFFAVMAGVVYLWLKLYHHYELRSPVKARVFAQRLSAFLQSCPNLKPEISKPSANSLKATFRINKKPCPVSLVYSQNIFLNIGGIIPGTKLARSMFRPAHPRTWFLELKGPSLFPGQTNVLVDFSARQDDTDTMGAEGVRLLDASTGVAVTRPDGELKNLSAEIRKAIEGTLLKGTLALDGPTATLTLFDTLSGIHKWSKPVIRFTSFAAESGLVSAGIPLEQTAFHGADKLMALSFS